MAGGTGAKKIAALTGLSVATVMRAARFAKALDAAAEKVPEIKPAILKKDGAKLSIEQLEEIAKLPADEARKRVQKIISDGEPPPPPSPPPIDWKKIREERLNRYQGRPALQGIQVINAPIKEPQNEAETALLLQAMISSNHPGIDFVIGDYNTVRGVDLIIEKVDKDMPTRKWAELVFTLDKLYQWPHPPEGYHCVICYQLGRVKELQKFPDGLEAKLVPKAVPGRYTLLVGAESIDIYVLRDILTKK